MPKRTDIYSVLTIVGRIMLAWVFAAIVICLSAFPARAQQKTVEQWGVFEIALNGPTNGNPFLDVQFSARFTQGDSTIAANGFYDGDGIYRVRFMPEKQGEWHYVTESSSAELAGKTGEFTVTRPSSDNHGPVRVAHTFHFAYADGKPFKELGTTCYAWIYQDEPLEEQTLKTLTASPFNKIRMCVFPKRYDCSTNGSLLLPFEATSSANRDLTRFNPEFFHHLEQEILDLQKIGVEADVILFHPYDEGQWGFDRMPADADDRYLRYVVARLAAYHNVWWSLANEYDLMKQKTESDFVRFGEIVSSNDPYHHLLSIHNSQKIFNNMLPWITHAGIQNGSAVEDAGRAVLYRDVYRKPVVFDEVKYEGDLPKRWGHLSAEEMVFRFWEGTIAGTYVGHGETYLSADDVMWTAKGGVLKGRSPPRLAFLKKVLDDSPPEGIDPIDKWQNPEYGGQPGKYYLVYLGKQTPKSWEFILPAQKDSLADGMKFSAEVLDTWNMTVTPVEGVFTVKKRDAYFFADQDGRSIVLPGNPYMAIRIRRVE
jgi:hypothetical protein